MLKKFFLRFFLVFISIVVSLIIVEYSLKKYLSLKAIKEFENFKKVHKNLIDEAPYPDNSPIGELSYFWDPYIGFRFKPDQKTLNRTIDNYGFHNDKVYSKEKPENIIRIMLLGGSVAEGRADSETITHYLENNFKKIKPNIEVINCGITRMMSTQERILFINEVLDFKPDIVLFLDGVNEFTPLRYNLKPGEYFYWFIGQYGISGGQPFSILFKNFLIKIKLKLIESSVIFRIFFQLLGDDTQFSGKNIKDDDINKAVEIYLKNVDIIRLIATAKNIKTLFFIQPILFDKKFFSLEEKYIIDKMPSRVKYLYISGYEKLKKISKEKNLILLTDIFDNEKKQIFIDFCHLKPKGNEIVSLKMMDEILKLIK